MLGWSVGMAASKSIYVFLYGTWGITDALQRGVSQGDIRFSEPALAASSLLASTEAAMVAAARGDVKGTRSDAVKSLIHLFLPGLIADLAAA